MLCVTLNEAECIRRQGTVPTTLNDPELLGCVIPAAEGTVPLVNAMPVSAFFSVSLIHSLTDKIYFYYCLLFVCMSIDQVSWYTCRGHRTTCGIAFRRVLRVKLRLSVVSKHFHLLGRLTSLKPVFGS